MERVLIVDDDAGLRLALRELLTEEGFSVDEVESGRDLMTALQDVDGDRPGLILMDVVMPGMSGMDALRELRQRYSGTMPVVVMTAYGSSNRHRGDPARRLRLHHQTVRARRRLATIRRYFDWRRLNEQVIELSTRLDRRDPDDLLIGNSAAMQEVYKTIGRVARSDATVLISGETGTGKELVASILHRSSAYSRGPLIKVNCAALPETLLESELFGHEKGSFTGAMAQRKGRFEMANKGTIFLDEVGEMTLATQKKLLRVLQEREFERVGGTITVKVDIRVIAATNKNLPAEIEEGRFREDLYYRLNVISIYLPPLRERRDDIPLLVEHFLHKHRYTAGSGPARISQARDAAAAGVRLAGQRPRAGERDRAGGDPRRGRGHRRRACQFQQRPGGHSNQCPAQAARGVEPRGDCLRGRAKSRA